jgi:hypothetical protein
MKPKKWMRKRATLVALVGAIAILAASSCLADWRVEVSASPAGTNSQPIVVCQNDPAVTATFSAIVTDCPPVSDSECSVSGPTWHWSGDVNDGSQTVSIPTDTSGTKRKTATATATYTFTPTSPSATCPGPDSKSNSATVTVVVLTGVAGQWTNIRTPNPIWPIPETDRRLVATLIDQGTVPPDQTPAGQRDWTYKSYATGTLTVAGGHDVLNSGTVGCNATLTVADSYSWGINASLAGQLSATIWKVLGISLGAGGSISYTHTDTYSYTFGSSGSNRTYKYEIWQPWEQIGLHCDVEKFVYTSDPRMGPYSDTTSRVDVDAKLSLPTDNKLDAACCGGGPQ